MVGGSVSGESRALFLSYASEDSEAAGRIAEALTAAGIEVWFDKSQLRGGDSWDATIRQQIRTCFLFVPLISAHTDTRLEGYFRREWKLAADRTHDMAAGRAFLIPVAIDTTHEATAQVPEEFRSVQWTRLTGGAPSPEFVARVAQLMDPEAMPSARAAFPGAAPPKQNRRRTHVIAAICIALSVLAFGLLRWRGVMFSAGPQAWSVAVLPFADLSESHDQEYFADGLAEEVRDLLEQVSDLKVSARTSSAYFKGRQTTTADIARALGVAHILEGSVRRAGDRIRVAVELVRADSGYRVWAQNFDRDVKDVFAVQDEIATAAVAALKLRLSPTAASVSARQTSSPEAYEAFLRGREKFYVGTTASHAEAIALFRHAIELDPHYAAAYAWLAQTLGSQLFFLGRVATADEWAERQQLIQRAIELAPGFADAYAVRSINEMAAANWEGARADLDEAIALDPHDARALRYYARYHASQGDLMRALEFIDRALVLDPLDIYALEFRSEFEQSQGAGAAARRDLERILEIVPGQRSAVVNLAWIDLSEGKTDAALARAAGLTERAWRVSIEAGAKCMRGDRVGGTAMLDAWVEETGADASLRQAIRAYAACGATVKAVTLIEREIDRGNELYGDFLVEALLYSPDFAPLKGDAHFEAIVRRLHPHA